MQMFLHIPQIMTSPACCHISRYKVSLSYMYFQKVSLKVPPQGIAYIAEGISKRYLLPRSLLKVSFNCPWWDHKLRKAAAEGISHNGTKKSHIRLLLKVFHKGTLSQGCQGISQGCTWRYLSASCRYRYIASLHRDYKHRRSLAVFGHRQGTYVYRKVRTLRALRNTPFAISMASFKVSTMVPVS